MANEGLWEQVLALDAEETAQRAQCRYSAQTRQYVVLLLNKEYAVDLSAKRVFCAESCCEVGFGEELCILAYLISSRALPIAGKLAPAESLPGGQFFFRGLHALPTGKLEEVFGRCPEGLYAGMDEFGARRCEYGDASVQLHVLPRVPLTIVIWRGDEEFAARASILFDQTAADQLPLDALGLAVNLAVEALVNAAGAGS